jgi:hypothetical protein
VVVGWLWPDLVEKAEENFLKRSAKRSEERSKAQFSVIFIGLSIMFLSALCYFEAPVIVRWLWP